MNTPYFISGIWAGIYLESGDGNYIRAAGESEDDLPARLTRDEVAKLLTH